MRLQVKADPSSARFDVVQSGRNGSCGGLHQARASGLAPASSSAVVTLNVSAQLAGDVAKLATASLTGRLPPITALMAAPRRASPARVYAGI